MGDTPSFNPATFERFLKLLADAKKNTTLYAIKSDGKGGLKRVRIKNNIITEGWED